MAPERFNPTSLTLPIVIVGTILGSLVFASNLYFGLQFGSINTMSQSTALVSFALFRSIKCGAHFTPTENVLVQTIASSIAGMPISASLLSVIPAFEFFRQQHEGGQRHFSYLEITIWSLGVSLLGTVIAAPFRTYFLLRKRLRFPGGFATGVLLASLHNDSDIARSVELDKKGLLNYDLLPVTDAVVNNGDDHDHSTPHGPPHQDLWSHDLFILIQAFSGTAIFVFLSYSVPILHRLPIFGSLAASPWLWFLSLSPALVSFGMIVDLPIAFSMMMGAVIGWGILSPLATRYKWAPGPIDSMDDGVRGWLVWIAIAALSGDTAILLLHTTRSFIIDIYYKFRALISERILESTNSTEDECQSLLSSTHIESSDHGVSNYYFIRHVHTDGLVSRSAILYWLCGSIVLCIICTRLVFDRELQVYVICLAIGLSFPLCLVVMQSTGETDTAHAPSNSLSNACQFIFSLLVTNSANQRLATMVASAITEAGLWQSAVLMTDLKTAYLVRASPEVMFHAQILGSVIGCFSGSAIYRFLSNIIEVPRSGGQFPAPLAQMWINTAHLARGGILPEGVPLVASIAFAMAACLRVIGILSKGKSCQKYVPSGIAIAIGLLVPPSVTLSKLIGAGIRFILVESLDVKEMTVMIAATGCILGEGILGFLPPVLHSLLL